MPKAFDTYQAQRVAACASQIKAAGYAACGLYYFQSSAFKQLLTREVAEALTAAGLWVFSVYENGRPTDGDYFTGARGRYDGQVAAQKALAAGQPPKTPIYFAVDYDASEGDLSGITAYFKALRPALQADGYTVGVYGSGLVCRHLTEVGMVEKTWLSQSRGFQGYQDFLPRADIVQGPSTHLFGMDVDSDTTSGSAGGWQVEPANPN